MEVRRMITTDETVLVDNHHAVQSPARKIAAVAVVTNPFAGRFEPQLEELVEIGGRLGTMLAQRCVDLVDPATIESFGKACIVGEAGELEHAAALIHPTFGQTARAVIGGGAAIIPSTKKVGGPDSSIDLPLVHRDHAAVASHFDSIEIRVPGSPRADEVVVAFGIATGGRPHPRIAGLKAEDIPDR